MPLKPIVTPNKPSIWVPNQFRRQQSYRALTHSMSATRHNLAALVDEQSKSQGSEAKSLRVAEADMPSASGSKVLVRMLARPVNPSGQSRKTKIFHRNCCMQAAAIEAKFFVCVAKSDNISNMLQKIFDRSALFCRRSKLSKHLPWLQQGQTLSSRPRT